MDVNKLSGSEISWIHVSDDWRPELEVTGEKGKTAGVIGGLQKVKYFMGRSSFFNSKTN